MNVTPKLSSDSIELMSVYIVRMRDDEDFDTIPDILNRFNKSIFTNGDVSKDQLRQLAVYATDYICRFAAELELRDAYTAVYFKTVIAGLMKSLQDTGIDVFYILDNELREDRFELLVMLYESSGAKVVVPYDGEKVLSFEEVKERLIGHMTHGKNIVYIEKDTSINYMKEVMQMATESKYIAIFRNRAPSDNYIEIL